MKARVGGRLPGPAGRSVEFRAKRRAAPSACSFGGQLSSEGNPGMLLSFSRGVAA
jgi:hypothetical protein